VYAANWNGQSVAVKIFRTEYASQSSFEEFENEVSVMASFVFF